MSNFKWNDKAQERILTESECVNVVMFVSRNKDNSSIEGFKERRSAFMTTWDRFDERLAKQFVAFSEQGLPGELSRFYFSVNDRDNKKVTKGIMHYMLDYQDQINPAGLPLLSVRIGMKRENALTKRRLFDFDSSDTMLLSEFVHDLQLRGATTDDITVYPTVNNCSVVIERGIDLRGLVDTMPDVKHELKKDKGPWKWSDIVTYKIDDLVLVDWSKTQ